LALVHLDYLELVQAARELSLLPSARAIRLALLADCSTQHLVPLLEVLFARHGIALEAYVADYDVIDAEILDPESGLYRFAPRYVVLLVAAEHLKTRLYDAANRREMADDVIQRFVHLWDTLKAHGNVTIIQSNFVVPSERAFGHYETKVTDSLGSTVAEINYGLAVAARHASHLLLCDLDHVAADVGRRHWTDETLWALAKSICRLDYLPLVADAIVRMVLAAEGMFVKCVILDLDNTLWGGVIGDDGLAGIVLGEFDEGEAFVAFQRFLKELSRRGIILAVVSKNDEATARRPFTDHPHMVLRPEDIAVFIANWENKVDNIRTVQRVLNIGLDSMVFVDDNPFERDLVRKLLPEVIVPDLPDDPALYVRALTQEGFLETASYSPADQTRTAQYREEAQRELARVSYHSIDEYLSSLGMTIKVERFSPFALPRIAQLIQRSNQFNLTTRRYNETDCEQMMHRGDGTVPIAVTLADRFGDYGLISIVILRQSDETLEIDTYLMSCRVLKRGVEQFIMNCIVDYARRVGVTRVIGSYTPTAKNSMVKDFYAAFGFRQTGVSPTGTTTWSLAPQNYQAINTFMTATAVEL
jgi:FkbH-like protein